MAVTLCLHTWKQDTLKPELLGKALKIIVLDRKAVDDLVIMIRAYNWTTGIARAFKFPVGFFFDPAGIIIG